MAAEVHRSKQISSYEPRALRRNVTTEFQWEVRSLKEQYSDRQWGITSQSFEVHGTEATGKNIFGESQCMRARLTFVRSEHEIMLSLSPLECYIVSAQATLSCAGHEAVSDVVRSSGHALRDLKLLSYPCGNLLCRAIHDTNSFCAKVSVTTVSASGGKLVETLIESGTEIRTPPSLADDWQSTLKSKDLADVTLTSNEGCIFPAHRLVLATRSPVFRAMFCGGMREAHSGEANIDASSSSVQQLLSYIYTDGIDVNAVEPICFEVFELGAQYELPRLKALVKEQMFRTLSVANVAQRFVLSARHSISDLENACKQIIQGNLSAVMSTDGWKGIKDDPSVMAMLIDGPRKRSEEEALTPRKLKRQRAEI